MENILLNIKAIAKQKLDSERSNKKFVLNSFFL